MKLKIIYAFLFLLIMVSSAATQDWNLSISPEAPYWSDPTAIIVTSTYWDANHLFL